MTTAIIGTGTWGTATAIALHRQQPTTPVVLWGRRAEVIERMAASRRHAHLGEATIDPAISITHDPRDLAAADLVMWAVPTQHTRAMAASLAGALAPTAGVVSLSKGLEQDTRLRVSQILAEELGAQREYAVLSGPSHAEEVAAGLPAALSLAGPEALCEQVVARLHGPHVRLYTVDDLVGVELAGALKNVIAIAAGIVNGLKLGDNALAALVTRGVAEMTRLGRALSAHPATFAGLSGIGDLLTTCYSPFGRNRALGQVIATGVDVPSHLASTGTIAEGAWTCRAAVALAEEHAIDVPIASQVASICWAGKPVDTAIAEILARSAKEEQG